jgi:serine/threonine protein kinase
MLTSVTSYESLTFATKTLFAQEIARGLSALHSYGIVHGDLKPQNVLVFESPLTVKLADFSHSFFDTGESREVVGGTTEYAAPEWKTTATTSQLMKTDLYSYGIVFAELMAGRSVFEPLRGDEMHNEAAFVHDISSLKASGEAAEYILSFLHEEDAEVLTLTLEDFPLIEGVIGATIRVNPLDRDLSLVLRHLGDK